MEKFTWGQIFLAVFGSGGTLMGLLGLAKLISERLDARNQAKEEQSKASLEARRDGNAEVWKIVDAQAEEIRELKAEAKLTRPVVRDIYRKLTHLEQRAKALRVAQCPDEVADIINGRITEFLDEIGQTRDLLP